MTRVKQKSSRMLSMEGSEFRRVITSRRIPFSELSVRNGLRIRITLIAETFSDLDDKENQPRITTVKSS